MKRQIRRRVFETNSSSMHSLTMCLESDYDKWEAGKLLLVENTYGIEPEYAPKGQFCTYEEAIEALKHSKCVDEDFDFNNEDKVNELLHDKYGNFCTYDDYFEEDEYGEEEFFVDNYRTPSGEEIKAFGKYSGR